MNKLKYYSLFSLLIFLSQGVFAEGEVAVANPNIAFEVLVPTVMLCFVLLVLIILMKLLVIDIGRLVYHTMKQEQKEMPWVVAMFGIFEGDNQVFTGVYHDVEIEGHTYDGITEYDNDLPPWWKALFYITIVFSVIYIGYYHFMKDGNTMEEEYQAEVAQAAIDFKDVDIKYEAPITDAAALANAKAIFIEKCAACHREDGGGSVGPNLTDAAWIHGGNINEVYMTIKNGVIEKGMIPWKNDYNNQQIYEIASYVLSLQGTNPPNPKAPQGK